MRSLCITASLSNAVISSNREQQPPALLAERNTTGGISQLNKKGEERLSLINNRHGRHRLVHYAQSIPFMAFWCVQRFLCAVNAIINLSSYRRKDNS